MKKRAALNLAAIFFISTPGFLQSGTFTLGPSVELRHRGTLRNVLTTSRTLELLGPSQHYIFDIQRFRSDWLVSFKGAFRLAAVYDHELRMGDYLETPEYALFKSIEPVEMVNLDTRIIDRKEFNWRHRLYRLFAEWDKYPLRITLGRQQISWGTGYFWNPTDLFNPVTFALVERDERHGVDAVSLELSLGTLSQLHIVWAPADDPHLGRGAVRLKTNLKEYDFSVMGGWIFRDRVIGADFSGAIRGAGFRGEWLHNFAYMREAYDQAVLGVDYHFKWNLTFSGEYLYNSGALSPVEILAAFSRSQAGSVISVSRHLGGFYADYQVHPLVHVSGYLGVDLDQGGAFFGPRISWNILTNLDLEAGALIGTGEGEFGLSENACYLTTSWYF
ncbi:MAG TPA: hypothetical protein VM123_04500 [archaeon]|nr:hypothetical protein [archaeon]